MVMINQGFNYILLASSKVVDRQTLKFWSNCDNTPSNIVCRSLDVINIAHVW